MELQFFNAPQKSLCFVSAAERSMAAWTRVKAMHAPWLVVLGPDGQATGVMPAESLRDAMRAGPHGIVAQLPSRGAAVLPHRSKLSEVLRALESAEIEAVLLVEGDLVHTVVMRADLSDLKVRGRIRNQF
ncbi:MAG: hypothetical protein Q8L48_11340 [Archangium sp.]|nr:hypothetical protein [Archangium sp.]